ncbi:MAG: hypothetical protein LBG64_02205, partial [Pseudomonadales bacterium]|nr:hypothetical protein [Pseudomonadales bacterium]
SNQRKQLLKKLLNRGGSKVLKDLLSEIEGSNYEWEIFPTETEGTFTVYSCHKLGIVVSSSSIKTAINDAVDNFNFQYETFTTKLADRNDIKGKDLIISAHEHYQSNPQDFLTILGLTEEIANEALRQQKQKEEEKMAKIEVVSHDYQEKRYSHWVKAELSNGDKIEVGFVGWTPSNGEFYCQLNNSSKTTIAIKRVIDFHPSSPSEYKRALDKALEYFIGQIKTGGELDE